MTAEEHCYRHPSEATGVHCTRCDRPICPKCMVTAAVGFHCPECVAEGAKTTRTARTIYGGKARPGEAVGLITRALVAINVAMFIATTATGNNFATGHGNSKVFEHLSLIPPAVANGEWWRLVTAAFLHIGILHLALNMLALWWTGPVLEASLGRARFIALYFLAGIGGNLLSTGVGAINSESAGASGAIFGLFAALYVVMRHRNFNTQPIVTTIFLNLIFTFSVSGIDWRGHVGGLITGAAVAGAIAFVPQGPRRNLLQAGGVIGISVVLAAAGVLAVHRTNHRCEQIAASATALGSDLAACIIYDRPAVSRGEHSGANSGGNALPLR